MKIKQVIYSLLLCSVSAVYSGADEPVYVAEKDYKAVEELLFKKFKDQAEKLVLSPEFKGDSFVDPECGTLLNLLAVFDCVQAAEKIVKNEHINMKSGKYGATPLCIAAQYGALKMCELLLKKGANASITTWNIIPIRFAAANGHLAVVKRLYKENPKDMMSALYAAARGNRLSVVEYLLSQGADKTVRDANGKLAVDYATDSAVVQLLALPIKQDGTLSAKTRGCVRALALKWTA